MQQNLALYKTKFSPAKILISLATDSSETIN